MLASHIIPSEQGLSGSVSFEELIKNQTLEELKQLKKQIEWENEEIRKNIEEKHSNLFSINSKQRDKNRLYFNERDLALIETELKLRANAPAPQPASPPVIPQEKPQTQPAEKPQETVQEQPQSQPAEKPQEQPTDQGDASVGTDTGTATASLTDTNPTATGENTPTKPEEPKKEGFFTTTNIIILVLLLGAGAYFYSQKK